MEGPTCKQHLTEYHRECYAGKDVHRFCITYTGRYCYFNRIAKRGGCWDEGIHDAKGKILVRQVGNYPEGGIDTHGYAVLNAAFMIVPVAREMDSRFLLGVINSSAIRFYWQSKFIDDRKTFPKIKGEYLKLLPIPIGNLEHQKEVIRLVDQVISAKASDASSDTEGMESEINNLVNSLYDLTPEEIQCIGESVA